MARPVVVPGGVDEYIAKCPKDLHGKLEKIRAVIKKVVPNAVETVSYFGFPGYQLPGDYYYSGMFAWFSYKKPFIRVHVFPPVAANHKKEVPGGKIYTGAVGFPEDGEIPLPLVKKMVEESLEIMKSRKKD